MPRPIRLSVLLFAACGVSALARADDAMRFGVSPSVSAFHLKDPDGPTANGSAFTPLSGLLIASAGRDARVLVHIQYDSFDVAASTTDIGQNVRRVGGDVSYQTLFRLSRAWKPWGGIGLGYTNESYTTRYTLTPGRHLASQYPDRTSSSVALVVNTSTEWRLDRDWSMGAQLQYEQPLGSGASALRFGLYLVY